MLVVARTMFPFERCVAALDRAVGVEVPGQAEPSFVSPGCYPGDATRMDMGLRRPAQIELSANQGRRRWALDCFQVADKLGHPRNKRALLRKLVDETGHPYVQDTHAEG